MQKKESTSIDQDTLVQPEPSLKKQQALNYFCLEAHSVTEDSPHFEKWAIFSHEGLVTSFEENHLAQDFVNDATNELSSDDVLVAKLSPAPDAKKLST